MAYDKTTPAIELINVSRRSPPTGKSPTALRDFTMTVERGEFVAVVVRPVAENPLPSTLSRAGKPKRRRGSCHGRPRHGNRPAHRLCFPK